MAVMNRNEALTYRDPKSKRFAVILAGGDGMRLRKLTKKLTGREIPKQFCPVFCDDTLLTVTQKRVGLRFRPENIYYSLTKKHEEFFQPLLREVTWNNRVIQPNNKGTAAAILYAILRLSKLDPEGTVAFFPSDHYVSDDEVFMNQVERAFQAVKKREEAVVLLGIEPAAANGSYGWIEPSEKVGSDSVEEIRKVKRFWEKPTFKQASELMDKGSLWNSFVLIGKIKSFLNLFKEHLPKYYKLFCAGSLAIGTLAERMTIKTIYRIIEDRNFSYDILEKSGEQLYVLPSGGFVWSDLGEPKEVLLKMAQLGLKDRLIPAKAA